MEFRADSDGRASEFETLSVTAGEEPTPGAGTPGDVTMPIHLSSTFAIEGIDTDVSLDDLDPAESEYIYSRLNNPTRHAVEQRLAALEGGDHGLAFASGTAAIFTTVLAVVEPGDHVVAFEDLYSGTARLLAEVFEETLDVDLTLVDARDPDNVAAAIRSETELIWMESPTNPLLRLCDVAAIAAIAADHDVVFGVDNTFATPYLQRPLALGADVVVHSTTKYLNGHSDSVGGAVVTNDVDLLETLQFLQQIGLGNTMAPFDAYQVLRGTKTFPVRMRRHETNAADVAAFLDAHEAVSAVHYPGLEAHPQHDLATAKMSGFGGVLSFELAGGLDDVEVFIETLDRIPLAVSLGGVETLVEHPASMTHTDLSADGQNGPEIPDSLVRMSVGLEHPDDLVEDLGRALEAVEETGPTSQ